jgi:exopolysaccharide biosynthesis WecB/TagA/CpsF family protein
MLDARIATAPEAVFADVPRVVMAGLPIAALGLHDTARLMVQAARRPRPGRPLYLTSANGEVISRCAREPGLIDLFRSADLVSADGQPMVAASRLVSGVPLPERVATTDLFPIVADEAARRGLTFYMLGATEAENRRAVVRALERHPGLRIVGRSHGYLAGPALDDTVAMIDRLAPDILWLALGVPREQAFVRDFAHRLPNVGVIKTAGGLFNFLSGTRVRAPALIQAAGLEWAWRLAQEPRRLFWRYAVTNPHAAYLLLTASG